MTKLLDKTINKYGFENWRTILVARLVDIKAIKRLEGVIDWIKLGLNEGE